MERFIKINVTRLSDKRRQEIVAFYRGFFFASRSVEIDPDKLTCTELESKEVNDG